MDDFYIGEAYASHNLFEILDARVKILQIQETSFSLSSPKRNFKFLKELEGVISEVHKMANLPISKITPGLVLCIMGKAEDLKEKMMDFLAGNQSHQEFSDAKVCKQLSPQIDRIFENSQKLHFQSLENVIATLAVKGFRKEDPVTGVEYVRSFATKLQELSDSEVTANRSKLLFEFINIILTKFENNNDEIFRDLRTLNKGYSL